MRPPTPFSRRRAAPTARAALSLSAAGALIAAAGGGAGCSSPLARSTEADLRRTIVESSRREVFEAQRTGRDIELSREDRVPGLNLKPETLAELESKSGMGSYAAMAGTGPAGVPLGPSLLGVEQRAVGVNLQRAVTTAARNNLNVQFASLGPAIAEAAYVQATAAFDMVFFTNGQWQSLDQQRISTQQGSPPAAGTRTFDERQEVTGVFGVRQRTVAGGIFTVQQTIQYTDVGSRATGLFSRPDPASIADLTVQLDQPLLRNAGSDAVLAEVRLAANAERDRILQLRAEVSRTITDTEEAYWNLVAASAQLQIARRVLDRGTEVREVISKRARILDANQAQVANAAAAVEQRKVDVNTAENALRIASDRLKELMNDPELTVGSEVLLLPVDQPLDVPIAFNLAESFATAIAQRPEIQRGLLGIDDASIRVRLADVARLPQLDMRALVRFNALASSTETAVSRELEGSLVDYLIGLALEIPIGNRAAEAEFRRRNLERLQAVITHRDVIRRIISDVKTQLRTVSTAYEQIGLARAARIASAEQLRSLEARERTVQVLSPEFLDFKLRTQQELAAREVAEIGALTRYNTAIAQYYQSMGAALERNRIKFEVPDAPRAGR
jgi:outer membrane protein TolC